MGDVQVPISGTVTLAMPDGTGGGDVGTGGVTPEQLAEAVAPLATKAALDELAASAASIEDLLASATLLHNTDAIGYATSYPVFVAPYPLRVTGFSLVQWNGQAIAPSSAAFWRVDVRVGGARTIASKSTTTEGIPVRRGWAIPIPADSPAALVEPGEVIDVGIFPTGSVPPLQGTLLATVRFQPR